MVSTSKNSIKEKDENISQAEDSLKKQEILEVTIPAHLANIVSKLGADDRFAAIQLMDALIAELKSLVSKDESFLLIENLLGDAKERLQAGDATSDIIELLNEAMQQIA